MAKWKKIITSGSIAELQEINVDGSVTAQQFFGDGSNLSGINTTTIFGISGSDNSNAEFNANTQDLRFQTSSGSGFTISVSGSTVTMTPPQDLKSSGSPTFKNLTLDGDLFVKGNVTELDIENLSIKDKFILLNSGSNSGDGGVIIQSGSNGMGVVFGWSDAKKRFGTQTSQSFSQDSITFNPETYIPSIIDIDDGQIDNLSHQKPGNIKIDNGDIYIYA